jgi:superfamily II DNA/RNA helicase
MLRHSIDTEIKNLSNPPAVLIGTRDVLLIILTEVLLEQINSLILDEFDKSLQLGFHEQMSFIIGKLTKLNKRVLVSATSDMRFRDTLEWSIRRFWTLFQKMRKKLIFQQSSF